MQEYIVLEITRNTEGNIGVYPSAKENENAAWKKYHQILSNAADSNVPLHGAMIMRADGYVMERKAYIHQEPEESNLEIGTENN